MHCFAHLEPYVWFTFRLCLYFLVCFMEYTLKTHHNKKRTRIYRKYATGMPLVESKCQHCLSKNQHSRKKSWNIFQTTETPNAVRFPSFMRHFLCLSVVFRRILHNIHPNNRTEQKKPWQCARDARSILDQDSIVVLKAIIYDKKLICFCTNNMLAQSLTRTILCVCRRLDNIELH